MKPPFFETAEEYAKWQESQRKHARRRIWGEEVNKPDEKEQSEEKPRE
jgi:hypothetical protein